MIIVDGIRLPFKYVSGSDEWPTATLTNSPYSKYVCELCGGEIVWKEFGVFNSFHKEMNDNDIINRVKWHWEHCPERKER
jgi:hypothetical protein